MPRYTDQYLLQILNKAARRINRRLCLTNTAEEIVVDSSGCITPADSDLEDIVLLQAECMIAQVDVNNDFATAADGAGGGYFVRDGEQSFDTRGEIASRAKARIDYLDSKHGPCAELEREIVKEKLRRQSDMRDIW